MDNRKKVRVMARKISFLMPHQIVLTDLKELATQLYPLGADPEKLNFNSEEYMMGAYEALVGLIDFLREKGPPIK